MNFRLFLLGKKKFNEPKWIWCGYESRFRNLIIGEMAATSPNHTQEYKHKIVDACMNQNGTTTLLRCNSKGIKFDKNRKIVGCFILKFLSSLSKPYGQTSQAVESFSWTLLTGSQQKKGGRDREDQLNSRNKNMLSWHSDLMWQWDLSTIHVTILASI